MKENEEKRKKQVSRICIVSAILTGTGILVGYQIGKSRGMKISRKRSGDGWNKIADRVIESGETLGLMIPRDDGTVRYLDLKIASEDYEGLVRGFLNIYTI